MNSIILFICTEEKALSTQYAFKVNYLIHEFYFSSIF